MLANTSFIDRCLWRVGILTPLGPLRVNQRILAGIVTFHLLALLACLPWLFSWSGLVLWMVGHYFFGAWGMTIGYHRLLAHRGFTCPAWLEHGLAVVGTWCLQGTPMSWVAVHRMHHQHSDEPRDPHTPRRGFFWSHMGWFLVNDPAIGDISTYDRYARDLIQSRFYKNLERPRFWWKLQLIQYAAFLGSGLIAGGLATQTLVGAVQLSLSWLVWGVFVRTVSVWHSTWSVNSLTHLWGYRNFDTQDDSRNNWLVALVSGGEGWHNNHHAEPRCAAAGRRWWEIDFSYMTICALECVGLVSNVVRPGRRTAHVNEPRRMAA